MTDAEFDEFMEREGWKIERRILWQDITPLSDAETFKRDVDQLHKCIEVRARGAG